MSSRKHKKRKAAHGGGGGAGGGGGGAGGEGGGGAADDLHDGLAARAIVVFTRLEGPEQKHYKGLASRYLSNGISKDDYKVKFGKINGIEGDYDEIVSRNAMRIPLASPVEPGCRVIGLGNEDTYYLAVVKKALPGGKFEVEWDYYPPNTTAEEKAAANVVDEMVDGERVLFCVV